MIYSLFNLLLGLKRSRESKSPSIPGDGPYTVDDDDKIEVCLRGLGPQYKSFATSIWTRENMPSFADLVSMLIIEEKSLGDDSS